jgi:hypothetical protein
MDLRELEILCKIGKTSLREEERQTQKPCAFKDCVIHKITGVGLVSNENKTPWLPSNVLVILHDKRKTCPSTIEEKDRFVSRLSIEFTKRKNTKEGMRSKAASVQA